MSGSNTNPLILLPLRMICLGLMDLLTFTDFRHTDIPPGVARRPLMLLNRDGNHIGAIRCFGPFKGFL